MCQHHYFSLIINEKEWKNTHRNRCAELSLRFCARDFFLFAQRTIVHELWSSEKRQVEAPAFHKRECVVFNRVVSFNTHCFIERRKISPAWKIKPIPKLANVTQIISMNMFWELYTLLRGKNYSTLLPNSKFIFILSFI